MMKIAPMSVRDARAWLQEQGRGVMVARGALALGLELDGKIVGAAVAGEPINPLARDGWSLQIESWALIEGGREMLQERLREAAGILGYERTATEGEELRWRPDVAPPPAVGKRTRKRKRDWARAMAGKQG